MRVLIWCLVLSGMLTATACSNFFGEKTDTDFIDVPEFASDVDAYVPILPILTGFSDPVDVLAGYDELFYVVDQGTSQIIAHDQAGRPMASYTLPGVKAVAQDRRLNLLAIATADTTIGQTTYSVDAIYRLQLYNNGLYDLGNARIIKRITHPFYFKPSINTSDTETQLNDIAVLGNNRYYVTRSGLRNSPTQFGGPDDNILYFDSDDTYLGTLPVQTTQGQRRDFFRKPFGIATFAQPAIPPAQTVSNSEDFIFSSLDSNLTLQVLYMKAVPTDNGTVYQVNTDLILGDTTRADGFLYEPHKFQEPVGLTVQFGKSGTNYVFVADAGTDSLYQFSTAGLEGISPAPTATSLKWINVSFGGPGTTPTRFDGPAAVANLNNTLYICDRSNRRILRYRLARDLE